MGEPELAFKIANDVSRERGDGSSTCLEEAIGVVARDVSGHAPVSPERAAAVRKWVARLTDGANLSPLSALELLVAARRELVWIRRAILAEGLAIVCASMSPAEADAFLTSVVDEIKQRTSAHLSMRKTSSDGI